MINELTPELGCKIDQLVTYMAMLRLQAVLEAPNEPHIVFTTLHSTGTSPRHASHSAWHVCLGQHAEGSCIVRSTTTTLVRATSTATGNDSVRNFKQRDREQILHGDSHKPRQRPKRVPLDAKSIARTLLTPSISESLRSIGSRPWRPERLQIAQPPHRPSRHRRSPTCKMDPPCQKYVCRFGLHFCMVLRRFRLCLLRARDFEWARDWMQVHQPEPHDRPSFGFLWRGRV